VNPPDLKDVLAEVNRLRAGRGMEPLVAMPKGNRCVPDGCLIARALGGKVMPISTDDRSMAVGRGIDDVPLPAILSNASYAFDDGEYPELVA
jgi:hypothetical protein